MAKAPKTNAGLKSIVKAPKGKTTPTEAPNTKQSKSPFIKKK